VTTRLAPSRLSGAFAKGRPARTFVIPDLIRDPATLAAAKDSGTPGQARGDGEGFEALGVEM
jgi:hypothetical protein